jgi:hypothetical protein
MKNKLISVKNHFVRHRFKYGVVTGLTVGLCLVVRNQNITNKFLMEHDLYDKFYEIGIDI